MAQKKPKTLRQTIEACFKRCFNDKVMKLDSTEFFPWLVDELEQDVRAWYDANSN